MRYIPDREYVAERIADLAIEIDGLNYELAASIAMARGAGFTWDEVAGALGLGSKQAAQQRFKRAGIDASRLEARERDRIDKLIGVRWKSPWFEVRDGAGAIASTHKKIDRARESFDRFSVDGDDYGLWKVSPDGKAIRVR